MKLDLNIKFKNLDGSDAKGEEPAKFLAILLANQNSTDKRLILKNGAMAEKLFKEGCLEVDDADLKYLIEFVEKYDSEKNGFVIKDGLKKQYLDVFDAVK